MDFQLGFVYLFLKWCCLLWANVVNKCKNGHWPQKISPTWLIMEEGFWWSGKINPFKGGYQSDGGCTTAGRLVSGWDPWKCPEASGCKLRQKVDINKRFSVASEAQQPEEEELDQVAEEEEEEEEEEVVMCRWAMSGWHTTSNYEAPFSLNTGKQIEMMRSQTKFIQNKSLLFLIYSHQQPTARPVPKTFQILNETLT